MFVNGILFNSEALYAIKQKHVEELEQISDEIYYRGTVKDAL